MPARSTTSSISAAFAATSKGSLHRYCGVPYGTKIPLYKLRYAARLTTPLGAKARLVLRLRRAA